VASKALASAVFGVRQLAAAFPRRELASGSASSKLETEKRQQAAALQRPNILLFSNIPAFNAQLPLFSATFPLCPCSQNSGPLFS
jgi:hypothetical protein